MAEVYTEPTPRPSARVRPILARLCPRWRRHDDPRRHRRRFLPRELRGRRRLRGQRRRKGRPHRPWRPPRSRPNPRFSSRPPRQRRLPILSVRSIEKVFGSRDSVTHALAGVSFDVAAGEFVGIMGPSGSGKTTLLNCVSTIDTVTSGHIIVGGRDITGMSKRQLAKFRRDDLGFIFQDSNLLDTLTGFENISLALTIKGEPARAIPGKVNAMAARLGVDGVLQKYPLPDVRRPEAAWPRPVPWSPTRSSF